MGTELPRHLIRLLVALLRHQARTWLGEEFMEAAGDVLAEIGGEELQRGLDEWLRAPQVADQLLQAARRAEEYVQAHCPDPALRGALTLRFADLPAVQAALADLPGALDSSGVERALREALTRDLGRVLTPVQIEAAARLYTDALLRAVSTLKDFALPVIAQTVQDIRREQREQTAMLAEILQRLGRGEALQPEETAALGQAILRGRVTVQGDVSHSVFIIGYGNTVNLGPSQAARLRPQVTLPGDLPPGSYIPFPRNRLFTGREEDLRQLEGVLCGPHPSPQPPPLSRKRERGGGAAEGGGGGVRAQSPLPLAHPVGEGEGPGEGVRAQSPLPLAHPVGEGEGPGVGVRALITQAITGMGGVGKTQLAVEFAYRYGYRFRSVHWLDLSKPALLDEQIAENGARMGLEPWPDKLPDQVARTLQAWQAEGPRLLILDNLEDPAAAQGILARLSHSSLRLLLTARRRDWPRHLGLQMLRLDEFTPEESRAFLRHFLPPDRAADADLDALAERLGHLPLALELAGRYLERHPRLSVGDYLNALLQVLDHPSMRGWRPDLPSPTKHDLSLRATFALSWEQVQDPDARRAFLLAGFCAPNVPIPESILERMIEDPVRRDEALGELIGLGLLEGSPESPAIHPLLAEFAQADARRASAREGRLRRLKSAFLGLWPGVGLRRHPEPASAQADAWRASAQEGRFPIGAPFLSALASLAAETNREIDRTGRYDLFAPLLPHLRAVAEKAEPLFPARPGSEPAADLALLWNSLGYHLHHVAAYAEARACYERALRIVERALGPEHPQVATAVNNLGRVLQDLGDLAGAKACYERALRIDEAAFGPDHPEVATDVNNLGSVLWALGDLAGAKACYERALRIFRQRLPPGHPDIRIVEENLRGVALHE
jgi:tetratricopeptide (TPR) repeat protein